MGTAAYGCKGFYGTAAVGGDRPIGAASCRQQHIQASCQPPPPPLLYHCPEDQQVTDSLGGTGY